MDHGYSINFLLGVLRLSSFIHARALYRNCIGNLQLSPNTLVVNIS